MLKLTLEETIAAHRKMWNWLAENPTVITKEKYPPFKELLKKQLYSEIPFHKCFLCEYAFQRAKNNDDDDDDDVLCQIGNYCAHCPLDWNVPKNITSYMCEESFYGLWHYKNPADRKQLAETIAGLPKKEI